MESPIIRPDKPSEPISAKDRQYYFFALRIIGDFGATIALPVVLLAWLGQRLDQHFQTGTKLTIAGFALAALLSGISMYRKARRYGREYQNLGKN